jgi:hypothetical protein
MTMSCRHANSTEQSTTSPPFGLTLVNAKFFGIFYLLLSVHLHDTSMVSSTVMGRNQIVIRKLSTAGWTTKTHTIENDDDNLDDGSHTHERTTDKISTAATSPYAIPSVSSSLATETTQTTNSNQPSSSARTPSSSTPSDDKDVDTSPLIEDEDSKVTSLSDMLDIEHRNDSNGTTPPTLGLPPEREPTETWAIAILALFSSMAISLCIVTGWRRWCTNKRRAGYQEISNLVV